MKADIFERNPLQQFFEKPKKNFTREDIISYIENKEIRQLNFNYVGGDGRIKTLNFPVQSKKQLENILTYGERVDGSSLFNNIETCCSDLYVVPKYHTAFIHPFTKIPTLCMLCSYFDKNGDPMYSTPENILAKATRILTEKTGYTLEAMGELEFYIISEKENLFETDAQRGYHESSPFIKWEIIRTEALYYLSQIGCNIKYSHSEVGNFTDDKYNYEQAEIEFLTVDIEQAAEELILGKWILRQLAYNHKVKLSFAPKITVGNAGSGLHIHIRLLKDGKSAMGTGEHLSKEAIQAIGGILEYSPALTAFGNTVPTSYLRLVPHQEAPTNICWGYRNRSALIRVPLSWTGKASAMIQTVSQLTVKPTKTDNDDKRTFEFRCPDGSADIYLLLSGLAVAVREGLLSTTSYKYADERFIDVNIFKDEHKNIVAKLEHLPNSCYSSAEQLLKKKDELLKYNVFDESIIDGYYNKLKNYNDENLSTKLYGKNEEIRKLVMKYFYC